MTENGWAWIITLRINSDLFQKGEPARDQRALTPRWQMGGNHAKRSHLFSRGWS
jgi:hypothetical protein